MEEVDLVQKKILELENQLDLVIIAEEMDQGLALLRHLMCWDISDVTYLSQNQRKTTEKNILTDATRKVLKEWLWADYMLYDHFKAIFDRKIQQLRFEDDTFDDTVAEIGAKNQDLRAKCVISHIDNDHGLTGPFKMALSSVLGYKMNPKYPDCQLFGVSEPYFTRTLRGRQYGYRGINPAIATSKPSNQTRTTIA